MMNLIVSGGGLIVGFVVGFVLCWRLAAKRRKRMIEKSRIEPIYYDLGRLLK